MLLNCCNNQNAFNDEGTMMGQGPQIRLLRVYKLYLLTYLLQKPEVSPDGDRRQRETFIRKKRTLTESQSSIKAAAYFRGRNVIITK